MNFPSLTLKQCSSINPQTVLDYLQQSQWQKVKTVPDRSSTWEIQHPIEGKLQILLPLDAKIPDFPDRMHDLIQVIAFIENRSETDIFNDFANVTQIAKDLGREILNLHLYFNKDQSQPEAPAKKLGNILSSLQDTLDAIGQVEGGRATPLGKIAQEITQRTSLDVISFFKGSFGIRLAAAPAAAQLNLIQEPLAETAIKGFIELINSSENKTKLSKLLKKYQHRTTSHYRKFLIALTDSEADLRIEWGSTNPEKSSTVNLSSLDAWRAIAICSELVTNEPEEYEIVGKLWAVDSRRKTFRLEDIYEGKPYFGKISDDVLTSGVEMIASPPRTYRARIQGTLKENPNTGEASLEYKLIALAHWDKTVPTENPATTHEAITEVLPTDRPRRKSTKKSRNIA